MQHGIHTVRERVEKRCLDVNNELQWMIKNNLSYTVDDLIRENRCMISILLHRSFFPSTVFSTEEVISLLRPIIESLTNLNSFEISGKEESTPTQLKSTFYAVVLLSKLLFKEDKPSIVDLYQIKLIQV